MAPSNSLTIYVRKGQKQVGTAFPRIKPKAGWNYLPDLAGLETGVEAVPCSTECGPEERT